jgi:DNA-binding NarL/FixJ family response regulator
MDAGKNKSHESDSSWIGRRARILIVDDHPIFRRGLRDLIAEEDDMEVCGEADNAPDALRQIEACCPDAAVIDLSLKSGHGIELIEQIRQRHEGVKMVVCSMHEESLFAERVLRAGAMGYVNKQDATDKLIVAIRCVLEGDVYLSPAMTRRLLHRAVGGTAPGQSPIDRLTNREMQVFEMIGQGLTTKQIARKLQLSPKTIDAHRENIKSKLNLVNSVQLSLQAFQWMHEKQ